MLGYKIELTAEEIASEVAANAAAAQAAESKNLSVHSSLGMSGSTPGAIASQTVSAAMVQAQMGGNSGINPAQASFQPSAHVAVVPDAQARQPQQLQQQHAITYVTTIRNRFANEPETYRAFLRILHTYQKEQKGIKDVLEQVSHLFADHPDLLMEFTYFLPDAVQDQVSIALILYPLDHSAFNIVIDRRKRDFIVRQRSQKCVEESFNSNRILIYFPGIWLMPVLEVNH